MDELLEAIRKSCSARVWSSGVCLAREDAVAGESADDDEIVLRVKTPERAVAPTVVLYPDDMEWDCDCPSSQNTCVHVVAAAIAVARVRKEGEDLPGATAAGFPVEYRFRQHEGGLALERFVLADERAHRVASTLSALLSGREPGPPVAAEQADLNIDRILGTRVRGALPMTTLQHVLTALADHPRVMLEGASVSVSREPVAPEVHVVERADGVTVNIVRNPRVTQVVTVGVVRCDTTLHLMDAVDISGGMLERLPIVQRFKRTEVGHVYGRLVPELARRMEVVESDESRHEITDELRPRVDFRIEQDGRRLKVLPTLVYGDPPCARVDGDELVHLDGPVPVRDLGAEKRVRARLRDALDLAPGRLVTYEDHDAERFMLRYRAYLGRSTTAAAVDDRAPPIFDLVPQVIIDDSGDGAGAGAGGRGVGLDVYFELAGSESGSGARVAAAKVLAAWRDGVELILLDGRDDAGMARLPADWLARFGHRVADLLAARGQNQTLPRHALFDLALLCADLDRPRPAALAELAPLFDSFDGLPAPALPGDLGADLRPYQRVGVAWLEFLRDAGLGAMLADDMGLGKTLQALTVMRGRDPEAGRGPTLVVCPTSVIYNWADEAARFRPRLAVCVYHGPRRELADDADLVVTSYALLRLDIERLRPIHWDMIVLDEAQTIKNPESQAARAAFSLTADFRMTASGTPVENRLDELWSQMHFANPGLLGGRKSFKERYAEPIAGGDADAAARLRARIRPFLLRRRKQDVAPELPPRTDALLMCELEDKEREVYDTVYAATRTEVIERLARGGSVMAALEALLRLRQAACHPALIPGQDDMAGEISSKVATLVDRLELVAAEDHKALVFSQWTSLLDLIEPWLERSGIGWTRLDGSTRDRGSVVRAFQSEDGPPVMLISLKAGGTGLNLTAADHVFLCDPWWNPAVEDQAADRAHRIGQDRPVMVYRMVARDTVEQRVLALQEKKRAIAASALDGADAAASLTRDDLMALLE